MMPNEEASRERRSPRGRDAGADGDDDASLSDGGRSGKGDERKGKGTKSARELARRRRRNISRRNVSKVQLGGDPRVVRAAAVAARRGPRRPSRRAVPRALHGRRPLPRARAPRVHAAEPEDRRARGGPARAFRQAGRLGQSRRVLAAARRPRLRRRGAHLGGRRERAGGRERGETRGERDASRAGRGRSPRGRGGARGGALPRRPRVPRAAAARGLRRRRLDADARGPGDPAGAVPEPGRRGASREPRAPHRADARGAVRDVLRAGHGRGAAAGVPDEAGGVRGRSRLRHRRAPPPETTARRASKGRTRTLRPRRRSG